MYFNAVRSFDRKSEIKHQFSSVQTNARLAIKLITLYISGHTKQGTIIHGVLQKVHL